MDRSKFLFGCLAILLLLSSCAPMPHIYNFEVKKETPLGIKLKIDTSDVVVAAIVSDTIKSSDSTFLAYMSKGFAEKLEDNLNLETGTIPVLNIDSDLVDIEDLYSRLYIMESMEKNMLIVFDSLMVSSITYDSEPYKIVSTIGVFDVLAIDVEAILNIKIYNDLAYQPLYTETDSMLLKIEVPETDINVILKDKRKLANYLLTGFTSYGKKLAEKFTFIWEEQGWILYICDRYNDWYAAYDYITDFEFDKAINIWMKYTSHKNSKIVSAAAYNISVACELSGDHELAERWLDYSDKTYNLESASVVLRKLINEKKSPSEISQKGVL